MKKILFTLLSILACYFSFGQTNTFPSTGNVGIGTGSPAATLHVVGTSAIQGSGSSFINELRWLRAGDGALMYRIGAQNPSVNNSPWLFDSYNGNDIVFTVNSAEKLRITPGGNVGIGISNPQSMLSVNGTVTAKQVTVTQTGWPDFVFHPSYKLRPISSLANYIQQNNHLPGIPSAGEIESRGLNLGDMQKKQMQKIEELTSYLIEQDSVIEKQKLEIRKLRTYEAKADKRINQLQAEVDLLSKEFEQLKNKK